MFNTLHIKYVAKEHKNSGEGGKMPSCTLVWYSQSLFLLGELSVAVNDRQHNYYECQTVYNLRGY